MTLKDLNQGPVKYNGITIHKFSVSKEKGINEISISNPSGTHIAFITKTVDGVWVNEEYLRDEDVRQVFMDCISHMPLSKKEATLLKLGLTDHVKF